MSQGLPGRERVKEDPPLWILALSKDMKNLRPKESRQSTMQGVLADTHGHLSDPWSLLLTIWLCFSFC